MSLILSSTSTSAFDMARLASCYIKRHVKAMAAESEEGSRRTKLPEDINQYVGPEIEPHGTQKSGPIQ